MGYEQLAAVDLGSNSFRLEVGRVVGNQIYSLDSLKEYVRLASGLSANKILGDEAQQRGLETLSRFAERLRGFQPEAVRAVATNTLRVAKNAKSFIAKAEAILGFPIEVIGGREEARLIYLGVSRALPPVKHKRLVVDIGGGSTELIIGKRIEPMAMESLFMGCVGYSLRFFPDGRVDKKRFCEAEFAAAREIEMIARDYQTIGWTEVAASSGTAKAIADILETNRFNPGDTVGISQEGLKKLKNRLIRAGSAAVLKLEGLRPERVPVFPGGLAIMSAVFSVMGIDRMTYAGGALRLGVLYDLLGRFDRHDMRDTTVRQFMRRYQVDAKQVARVERVAMQLLGQLIPAAQAKRENEDNFLRWSVALHEIGISIAHEGFHKHGSYIIRSADMPGFSKKDQERLALLILGQRGKLEKLPLIPSTDSIWCLIFCLRISALLCRSRDDLELPHIRAKMSAVGFSVELPVGWLQTNPLTADALADEAQSWQRVGWRLRVRRCMTMVV